MTAAAPGAPLAHPPGLQRFAQFQARALDALSKLGGEATRERLYSSLRFNAEPREPR